MNGEKQYYSDTEIDEYELKRYKFRKRKNSRSKNKDTIHPVIKKCKKCRQYMYNIYDGFCKSCHDNDQIYDEIYKMYDWIGFIFGMIFVPIFFIIPYIIKIKTDIFIYDTYNTTIEYELSKLSFDTRKALTLSGFIIITFSYMFAFQLMCNCVGYLVFNYLFVPILKYNYGYDEKLINIAIKTKYRQPTLYA